MWEGQAGGRAVARAEQHRWCVQRREGGGISRQVKFAVVNFAVGHFAGPRRFCVVPPPRVPSVYCECARNSRRTLNFACEISRSI